MITIKNLWKSYESTPVLKDLSLHIPAGRITVIFGRSGVGKSVLLKQIAGLEEPDQGTIYINGELFSSKKHKKDVGMLFQNSALFDSMTVQDNVAFALLHDKKGSFDGKSIQQAVDQALEKVSLSGFQKKFPSELSGGQKRRVALARLLAYQPKILLFDEPTAGLDPITGKNIASLIRTTQQTLGATAVLVTHDFVTGCEIGDYFALHHDGRILHAGEKETFFSTKEPIVESFLESSLLPTFAQGERS